MLTVFIYPKCYKKILQFDIVITVELFLVEMIPIKTNISLIKKFLNVVKLM